MDEDDNTVTVEEMNLPPGLFYIDDVKEDGNAITKELDKMKWIPLSGHSNSRVVQHYGYKYDYKTYNIYNKCDDIPEFLMVLQNILNVICRELGIINDKYSFNQCIVNNYYPGQGISRHTDVKKYGNVIGCFTLGGGATMTFQKDNIIQYIYTKPNSLYIMSGDSRYKWTHEMCSRKYDIVNDVKIDRSRRISVTFRNVP